MADIVEPAHRSRIMATIAGGIRSPSGLLGPICTAPGFDSVYIIADCQAGPIC